MGLRERAIFSATIRVNIERLGLGRHLLKYLSHLELNCRYLGDWLKLAVRVNELLHASRSLVLELNTILAASAAVSEATATPYEYSEGHKGVSEPLLVGDILIKGDFRIGRRRHV